jgi:general secretion pathway protein H
MSVHAVGLRVLGLLALRRDSARIRMTRRMPNRNSNRASGVSLLELLVVLAILALAAGMVLPTFGNGVPTSELRSAARQLAAGLRVARSEAVAQKRETFLTVDLEGRRFKIDRQVREYPLPSRIGLKLFTAQNDIVNEKVGAIRFFPDGGSNGGRITVAAGERKYEVDVDWLTGRVAIYE